MTGYRSDIWTSFTDHAMGDIAEWSGIEVDSRLPIGLKRRPKEIPVYLNFDPSLNLEKSEATEDNTDDNTTDNLSENE